MKSPILAVFGNTLHFVSASAARSRQLPDGADLTTSLLQLLAESGEQPRQVNLVYQPVDLQVVAAECANVSRAKLKAYFASEYRELSNPAIFWAATKPAPHLDGKHTTLLHYEQRPRLEHLLQTLEDQGVRARVALPLAAALVARSRSERLDLALLVADDCCFFYHVNELGIPVARFGRCFDALAEHLGVALASRKHPPANILVVADTPPLPLVDILGTHALRAIARNESWPEFLRKVSFNAADVANLATRPFSWKPQHTLTAIAAGLAVAACALAGEYTVSRIRADRFAIQADQHRRDLERRIAPLEAAEKRYRETEALLAAVPIANPRPRLLLEAVAQALPPSLQLNGCRYQSGQFTLEGVAHEGIGQEKGPFATFLTALASGSRPWTLKPPKATLTSPTWTLNGTVSAAPTP